MRWKNETKHRCRERLSTHMTCIALTFCVQNKFHPSLSLLIQYFLGCNTVRESERGRGTLARKMEIKIANTLAVSHTLSLCVRRVKRQPIIITMATIERGSEHIARQIAHFNSNFDVFIAARLTDRMGSFNNSTKPITLHALVIFIYLI